MSETEDALVGALQRVDAIDFARTGGFDYRGYAKAILAQEPRFVLAPATMHDADTELEAQMRRLQTMFSLGFRGISREAAQDMVGRGLLSPDEIRRTDGQG